MPKIFYLMCKNFNKVFRDEQGVVYFKAIADELDKFVGKNVITVLDGKAVAIVDGEMVPLPKVLYNEIGVDYHFIESFYEYGMLCAKKHGVYTAQKTETIRVWPKVKPGEKITTVIDGYEEHSVTLDENSVAAQNVLKNEFYAIPKEVLAEKYSYSHSEFDYDVYEPKAGVTSQWVYSSVNVFGVLWGGLEFLTTPMINITNPNDSYGCNFIVWWGNDGKLASYKVLKFISASGDVYKDEVVEAPVKRAAKTFQPPKHA